MYMYSTCTMPSKCSGTSYKIGKTLFTLIVILMQTGWCLASRRVTPRLAIVPTFLPLNLSFPIKSKHNFKVSNSRQNIKSIIRKLSSIQRVNFQIELFVCCTTRFLQKLYPSEKIYTFMIRP